MSKQSTPITEETKIHPAVKLYLGLTLGIIGAVALGLLYVFSSK